ncbi:uncharacterized protein LOC108253768, partial [Diaphorina citri]|uniref:Uncharacterized protein LOC108253768 n=1 Tax=Diaphorina citri TaxID=121845 RepID=A0A1S4ENU8_DIACI
DVALRSSYLSSLRRVCNGKLPVPEDKVVDYPPKVHPHGAVQSMSSLHTYIADEYFHNREMKVRCEASFSPVLWVGTKESTVLEEKVFRSKEASFLRATASSLIPLSGILLATLSILLSHVISAALVIHC